MQTTLIRHQVTIFPAQGYVNAANVVEFQNNLLASLAASPAPIFLLDMEQVDYIDSAGLMALVSALNLAKSKNIRFSICSVSPSVQMIFELTQLDQVFEIFENRQAFDATLG